MNDREKTPFPKGPWRPLSGVALVSLVALIGAVVVATRFPGGRLLGTLRQEPLDYSADQIDPIAPLSSQFVSEVFAGSIVSSSQDPSRSTVTLGPAVSPPPLPSPSPIPTLEPPPSPSPPVVPQSDLVIAIAANRSTAPPGGVIAYSLIVKNIGEAKFAGDILLRSHVPKGTYPCANACGGAPRMTVNDCIFQSQFASRQGGEHEYVFTASVALEPGQDYRHPPFYVCVGDVSDGFKITNHGHLTSATEEEVSEPVVVVVVVEPGGDSATATY